MPAVAKSVRIPRTSRERCQSVHITAPSWRYAAVDPENNVALQPRVVGRRPLIRETPGKECGKTLSILG
jgi:hypothetical protein